jgi:hypothetical protein
LESPGEWDCVILRSREKMIELEMVNRLFSSLALLIHPSAWKDDSPKFVCRIVNGLRPNGAERQEY